MNADLGGERGNEEGENADLQDEGESEGGENADLGGEGGATDERLQI